MPAKMYYRIDKTAFLAAIKQEISSKAIVSPERSPVCERPQTRLGTFTDKIVDVPKQVCEGSHSLEFREYTEIISESSRRSSIAEVSKTAAATVEDEGEKRRLLGGLIGEEKLVELLRCPLDDIRDALAAHARMPATKQTSGMLIHLIAEAKGQPEVQAARRKRLARATQPQTPQMTGAVVGKNLDVELKGDALEFLNAHRKFKDRRTRTGH